MDRQAAPLPLQACSVRLEALPVMDARRNRSICPAVAVATPRAGSIQPDEGNMKIPYLLGRLLLGIALLYSLGAAPPVHAAGKPMVIFVHGFLGFCRDEALGYKYWGGLDDLQRQLDGLYGDMEVRTVCVGPVSSNYDRAVELFWKIKGGCIDYGANHAATHRHERYFKNASQARNVNDSRQCPRANAPEEKNRAVHPQWDASRPVHIIAHSQGGQTARILAQLLASNGRSPEGDTNLFAPHTTSAAWIKSVTTIATPNDGTTLANVVVDFVPFAQTLLAGVAGIVGTNDMLYNFKLDHWDIPRRRSAESFSVYVDRVLNNSRRLFTDRSIRDISAFDLSPDGAMRTNDWVADVPGVYYFSWSTRATYTSWVTGWRYPRWDANPLISLFCGPGFMGNYSRSTPPAINSSWWDSDCVVPTRAQRAPTLRIARTAALGTAPSARSVVINDISRGGTPRAGQWNWLGLMDTWDHFDITGWSLGWSSSAKRQWYKTHIDRLRELP
jgi:triacylglycerol lipase